MPANMLPSYAFPVPQLYDSPCTNTTTGYGSKLVLSVSIEREKRIKKMLLFGKKLSYAKLKKNERRKISDNQSRIGL